MYTFLYLCCSAPTAQIRDHKVKSKCFKKGCKCPRERIDMTLFIVEMSISYMENPRRLLENVHHHSVI